MDSMITVQMLGGFSISCGDRCVGDQSNRMKKIWLLLAYLIFYRNSHITQEQYLSLLQSSESDESADPNGRMKAMFYRARSLLNQVNENAGYDWIIRKNNTYAWNTEIPLRLDAEEFETLCKAAHTTEDEEERLALYRQALELYRGDFLQKLSMEPWVMSISTYYHQLYMDSAEQAMALMESRKQWSDLAALCQKALKIESCSETVYQYLMRAGIAQNDRSGALRAYDELRELLFTTFGVMPSEKSRALYREASREMESFAVPVESVREQLREPISAKGALYCEYDFFKLLYQVQARSIIRSGDAVHIALFSLQGWRGAELSRRSLDIAMNNFKETIVSNLRQGDVVTRCSASQMLIMLPQSNYENSCAVCQRLLKAFDRKYPHSPVKIQYSVQPLEPLESALSPEHE